MLNEKTPLTGEVTGRVVNHQVEDMLTCSNLQSSGGGKKFTMRVQPEGEYPASGLYDVYMTMAKGGVTETSRCNPAPLTWERARQYVAPMLRMVAHHPRYAKVRDISILPSSEPYFSSDAARDNWLLNMAESGISARIEQRKVAERALQRYMENGAGHAKEISTKFAEWEESARELASMMFSTVDEVERVAAGI